MKWRVSRCLRPGENGTKQLLKEHGDRLLCVRYRSDMQTAHRCKTVELIVREWDREASKMSNKPAKEERPTPTEQPTPAEEAMFWFRFRGYLPTLFRHVRQAGGRRGPIEGVWGLSWSNAIELGLFHCDHIERVQI